MAYMKWFIIIFLVFSSSSLIAGIVEYQVLGPYSDQAVWAPFFDTILVESSDEEAGKMAAPKFTEVEGRGSIWGTIGQAFVWNYVIFDDGFGEWFRFIILYPLSAAVAVSISFMTLSIVIPWFRGG